MSPLLIISIIAGSLVFITISIAILFFAINRRGKSNEERFNGVLRDLQDNVLKNNESMRAEFRHMQTQFTDEMKSQSKILQTTNTHLNDRMDRAAKVISDVHRELGKMTNVARSIDDLQNILKAPKLRGGFGELFLGDLLGQILPNEHFSTQYRFKNGEAVDAVIYLGDKFVPVDSKFPLENFKKIFAGSKDAENIPKQLRRQFINDVKKHIQAVAKYIRTDEGTYDFALMYIPAENIYYEVAVNDDIAGDERELLSYALKNKVIPVSPNTLYAYLMTIIVGLKGLQIEKNVEEMLVRMSSVTKDFGMFSRVFSKLGTHLEHARKSYEDADKRIGKMEERLHSFQPDNKDQLVDESSLLQIESGDTSVVQ